MSQTNCFCLWKTAAVPIKVHPYRLTSVTRAENGFSHAYILMILMPDSTSFMIQILLSARVADLLLNKK